MTREYKEIRDELNTGDIVLFSGKGNISAGIKWATFSRWSHVGMVLKLPEYDFLALWESTTLSGIADLDTGMPRKGVQLVPLSERVANYQGDIAIRQLVGVVFDREEIEILMKLRREVSGRPYEQNMIELIKSAYDGPFGKNQEDLSSLFCSELVAEAYQSLGLLGPSKPSNEYTPADFSMKKKLNLAAGHLATEILIKGGNDE